MHEVGYKFTDFHEIWYLLLSPVTDQRCPEDYRKLRFPDYMTMTQDGGKVTSLGYRPLLTPENASGTHFC